MQWYDTIQYNSVYLTCSKKLTGSQLSLPHEINKKLKCETRNKMMSMIAWCCPSVCLSVRLLPVLSQCSSGFGHRELCVSSPIHLFYWHISSWSRTCKSNVSHSQVCRFPNKANFLLAIKTGTVTMAKLRPLTSEMLWLVARKVSTNGRIRSLRALFTSWENPKSRTSWNRADVAPRSLIQLYVHTTVYITSLSEGNCTKYAALKIQHF